MAGSTESLVGGCMHANIVSFEGASVATQQTAQALVLLGLSSPKTTAVSAPPLVRVSNGPKPGYLSDGYKTSGYNKYVLFESDRPIRDALRLGNAFIPDRSLLANCGCLLDERFIHAHLGSWDRYSRHQKLIAFASACKPSKTYTFTVLFSDRRRRGLDDCEGGGFFRRLRNELAALAKLGPLAIVKEVTTQGMPHLHGWIQSVAPLDQLRAGLIALGGSSRAAAHWHFQVKIKPSFAPVGWSFYCLKDAPAPADTYMSQSAIHVGERHVSAVREIAKTTLGISPDLRGRLPRARPGVAAMGLAVTASCAAQPCAMRH